MPIDRQRGYVVNGKDNGFGLNVQVSRPGADAMPVTYQTGVDPQAFRNVIPTGNLGDEAGRDKMNPAPMTTMTTEHYTTEQNDPTLHDAGKSMAPGSVQGIEFHPYSAFQPQRAPMPRNASSEVFLEGYGRNVADPRMTDTDAMAGPQPGTLPDHVDLYGQNRDGVAHNQNASPFNIPVPKKNNFKKKV
jgi:hypothetical protein